MANIKVAYGTSAALTCTLASLATSSTLVAGRESTAVSNTTNLYLDYLVAGKITTGTSPTAGIIEVWAYGSTEDTPTYPGPMDGTDSAEDWSTSHSRDILTASMARVATLVTSATSNITYWFGPVSLAGCFSRLYGGGLYVPKNWGLFVVHNTVAAIHATGGNHALWQTGVYMTA